MSEPESEVQNRRVERKAPSASSQLRERLAAAPAETRGRPADGDGMSRDEINERTSDANFQENPDLLTRRPSNRDEQGYFVPQHLQKPGWVYEFKARTVVGQPISSNMVAYERNQGWRPVPAADIAEMLPPGYDKPVYEIDGLIAMMRPRRLQVEAKNEMVAEADRQRTEKLRQALTGFDTGDPRMPREAWGPNGPGRGAPIIEGEIGTWRPREEG